MPYAITMLQTATAMMICAAWLAGCDDGPASYGDDLSDPQLPARGTGDITEWLAAGHYLTWTCELEPHAPRAGSGHGKNRICSNQLHSSFAGSGSFPVGAASVKEIFSGGGDLRQYAVYRKVGDGGGGDTWYWYEGRGSDVVANGEGDGTCTGCHSRAPQDYVYTIVRM